MTSSVILDVGTRAVFHTALLVSLYFLFVGHNAPGGGFIGGLVGGSALVLRYVAIAREEREQLVRVRSEAVLGAGVFVAALSGFVGFVLEGAFLGAVTADLELPLLGEIHVPSVLFFDIGVYLVVIGLVLTIMRTLGSEAEW